MTPSLRYTDSGLLAQESLSWYFLGEAYVQHARLLAPLLVYYSLSWYTLHCTSQIIHPFSPYRYQLLKMVRVYGNIEKFDMLFHRSGPNAGQPRGFAFVSYKLRQDAIKAMNSLNGQLLGSKKICVKFAKNTVRESHFQFTLFERKILSYFCHT